MIYSKIFPGTDAELTGLNSQATLLSLRDGTSFSLLLSVGPFHSSVMWGALANSPKMTVENAVSVPQGQPSGLLTGTY